ncbi:MAG: glycoside hydrolase family 3 C-terminal domain-containing protein, partial [Bacilli bacterium]|nr:glycoside hydrolase family 3 C-terminal domain-containing protein [Bacilli bacterium]
MKAKTLRRILIPVLSTVAVVAVVATVAMNMFSTVMDDYLGRGASHINTIADSESWDTNFYEDKYASTEESKADSYKLAKQVQEEGSVLLKNNGVLPLASDATVAPFGNAYIHPFYGQTTSSGSAKWTVNPSTPRDVLQASSLQVVDAPYQKMLAAGDPDAIKEAEGTTSASVNGLMGGDNQLYEYKASIYQGTESSVSGSIGMVFIGRAGQESADKKYDGYEDGTPHYLALTQNEKDTIHFAKQNCSKVILIISSSATVELTPVLSGEDEVDAILQVGHVGQKGFEVLPDLLTGEVNPSGRTV